MEQENSRDDMPRKKNILQMFDGLVKRFIPNFNARAIVYLSVIFAIVLGLQIGRFSSHKDGMKPVAVPTPAKQETVIADQSYWDSKEYNDKIHNQTIDSFTKEFEQWLNAKDQEFSKRKFEDMLFINGGLTSGTGGDLATVVPESFNYLENQGRARYQYARDKGFLSDKPALIKLGSVVCDSDEKTEKVTGIELYDWRYASMTKLAAFMATKPDWKMQIGDTIFDVSDPRIEDKDILKLDTAQNQPTGLFSFLVLHDPKTNRMVVADSTILDKNGVDASLTLSRITSHWDKQPKLYFKYGYEGCKQINNTPTQINYGQSD